MLGLGYSVRGIQGILPRIHHSRPLLLLLAVCLGWVGLAEKRTVTRHGTSKHVHLQIYLIKMFYHQCDDPQAGQGQVSVFSVTQRTLQFVILCAWTPVS